MYSCIRATFRGETVRTGEEEVESTFPGILQADTEHVFVVSTLKRLFVMARFDSPFLRPYLCPFVSLLLTHRGFHPIRGCADCSLGRSPRQDEDWSFRARGRARDQGDRARGRGGEVKDSFTKN